MAPEKRQDMPLYEYECTECKRHTEKIQKFSDPEITQCPHCKGKLERVLSAPAISFKGGGWYADGYGSKPSAAKSEGDAPKAEGSSTKTDSGTSISASSEGSTSSSKDTSSALAAAAPSTPAPATAAPAASSSDKK